MPLVLQYMNPTARPITIQNDDITFTYVNVNQLKGLDRMDETDKFLLAVVVGMMLPFIILHGVFSALKQDAEDEENNNKKHWDSYAAL